MATPTIDRSGAGAHDVHSPAEVREALEPHATAETLALFDRLLDQACAQTVESDSSAPLRAFLEQWWATAQFAEQGPPPGRERRDGAAEFRRSWEARNGRPFPAAG